MASDVNPAGSMKEAGCTIARHKVLAAQKEAPFYGVDCANIAGHWQRGADYDSQVKRYEGNFVMLDKQPLEDEGLASVWGIGKVKKGENEMGREIRRVPEGWQHPRDGKGYIPMYDQDYEAALAEWQQEKAKWENPGNAKERERIAKEYSIKTFEDWHGDPPDPAYYRPAFTDDPTHYQIYETVAEGTPTSPVFASLDKMIVWLIDKGYSEKAARKFAEIGWAPSMVFTPGCGVSGLGIHSLDHLPD